MTYKDTAIRVKFTNEKVPAFVEQKSKEWVKYGEANNYPEFLVTLFNRSAKHNAIVTSKQLYISGQGWVFDPAGMEGNEIATLKSFIDSPNQFDTLEELSKKTILDCELFGGCYIRVVGSRGQKGVAEIYHEDFCYWRSNEDNTEFYYSDEWLKPDGSENLSAKPSKTLPAYDPNKTQKESLYYFKTYRPSLQTYTLPEYIGAVPAIITDAEIANFHRAEIQNGFKGSKMIVFKNGVPTDEEMKSVERKMKAKFSPTDQAGVFVIDFVDDPTRVPEILDLGAGDFADKYNALNETIQQEIFVGHKITSPMLFGVRIEGQLGGRNEMVDAYNLFQNTYVNPKQRTQEAIYNLFAPVKGKLTIKKLEPIMPSFSEQTLSMILTKDEMRSIIGRKPLETNSSINKNVTDELNTLSPIVATKVLNNLTKNEIREIIGKSAIPGGDVIGIPIDPNASEPFGTDVTRSNFSKDATDYSVFSKYGKPVDEFVQVKRKKFMFGKQDFALSDIDQAIVDLIKNTPDITREDIQRVLKIDKTTLENSLEDLIAEELVQISGNSLSLTNKGENKEVKTFPELFIRYRYVIRPDAPPLVQGGESREFCREMIANPRYYSRQEIEMIGKELGELYDIPNYDAFRRRGGWYHDPQKDVNLPFCRHIWQQELVKKIK